MLTYISIASLVIYYNSLKYLSFGPHLFPKFLPFMIIPGVISLSRWHEIDHIYDPYHYQEDQWHTYQQPGVDVIWHNLALENLTSEDV